MENTIEKTDIITDNKAIDNIKCKYMVGLRKCRLIKFPPGRTAQSTYLRMYESIMMPIVKLTKMPFADFSAITQEMGVVTDLQGELNNSPQCAKVVESSLLTSRPVNNLSGTNDIHRLPCAKLDDQRNGIEILAGHPSQLFQYQTVKDENRKKIRRKNIGKKRKPYRPTLDENSPRQMMANEMCSNEKECKRMMEVTGARAQTSTNISRRRNCRRKLKLSTRRKPAIKRNTNDHSVNKSSLNMEESMVNQITNNKLLTTNCLYDSELKLSTSETPESVSHADVQKKSRSDKTVNIKYGSDDECPRGEGAKGEHNLYLDNLNRTMESAMEQLENMCEGSMCSEKSSADLTLKADRQGGNLHVPHTICANSPFNHLAANTSFGITDNGSGMWKPGFCGNISQYSNTDSAKKMHSTQMDTQESPQRVKPQPTTNICNEIKVDDCNDNDVIIVAQSKGTLPDSSESDRRNWCSFLTEEMGGARAKRSSVPTKASRKQFPNYMKIQPDGNRKTALEVVQDIIMEQTQSVSMAKEQTLSEGDDKHEVVEIDIKESNSTRTTSIITESNNRYSKVADENALVESDLQITRTVSSVVQNMLNVVERNNCDLKIGSADDCLNSATSNCDMSYDEIIQKHRISASHHVTLEFEKPALEMGSLPEINVGIKPIPVFRHLKFTRKDFGGSPGVEERSVRMDDDIPPGKAVRGTPRHSDTACLPAVPKALANATRDGNVEGHRIPHEEQKASFRESPIIFESFRNAINQNQRVHESDTSEKQKDSGDIEIRLRNGANECESYGYSSCRGNTNRQFDETIATRRVFTQCESAVDSRQKAEHAVKDSESTFFAKSPSTIQPIKAVTESESEEDMPDRLQIDETPPLPICMSRANNHTTKLSGDFEFCSGTKRSFYRRKKKFKRGKFRLAMPPKRRSTKSANPPEKPVIEELPETTRVEEDKSTNVQEWSKIRKANIFMKRRKASVTRGKFGNIIVKLKTRKERSSALLQKESSSADCAAKERHEIQSQTKMHLGSPHKATILKPKRKRKHTTANTDTPDTAYPRKLQIDRRENDETDINNDRLSLEFSKHNWILEKYKTILQSPNTQFAETNVDAMTNISPEEPRHKQCRDQLRMNTREKIRQKMKRRFQSKIATAKHLQNTNFSRGIRNIPDELKGTHTVSSAENETENISDKIFDDLGSAAGTATTGLLYPYTESAGCSGRFDQDDATKLKILEVVSLSGFVEERKVEDQNEVITETSTTITSKEKKPFSLWRPAISEFETTRDKSLGKLPSKAAASSSSSSDRTNTQPLDLSVKLEGRSPMTSKDKKHKYFTTDIPNPTMYTADHYYENSSDTHGISECSSAPPTFLPNTSDQRDEHFFKENIRSHSVSDLDKVRRYPEVPDFGEQFSLLTPFPSGHTTSRQQQRNDPSDLDTSYAYNITRNNTLSEFGKKSSTSAKVKFSAFERKNNSQSSVLSRYPRQSHANSERDAQSDIAARNTITPPDQIIPFGSLHPFSKIKTSTSEKLSTDIHSKPQANESSFWKNTSNISRTVPSFISNMSKVTVDDKTPPATKSPALPYSSYPEFIFSKSPGNAITGKIENGTALKYKEKKPCHESSKKHNVEHYSVHYPQTFTTTRDKTQLTNNYDQSSRNFWESGYISSNPFGFINKTTHSDPPIAQTRKTSSSSSRLIESTTTLSGPPSVSTPSKPVSESRISAGIHQPQSNTKTPKLDFRKEENTRFDTPSVQPPSRGPHKSNIPDLSKKANTESMAQENSTWIPNTFPNSALKIYAQVCDPNALLMGYINCDACSVKARFLCSGCKRVAYCSPNCQLVSWKAHKNKCSV